MNILQKFLQLENNDILNKIYSNLGKHPIIEKTRLKDSITTYTMRLNKEIYFTPDNTFSNFYFNNFSSNRPRAEQLGIVKSMLHRAHNLCDEEQGHRTDEVKLFAVDMPLKRLTG